MKATICAMLSEHTAKMDADIQRAVEEACSPENVLAVVQSAAAQAVQQALREEVEAFFKYGAGRRALKQAVEEQLSERK